MEEERDKDGQSGRKRETELTGGEVERVFLN